MQIQKYTSFNYIKLALLIALLFCSNLYLPKLSTLCIPLIFSLGIISLLLEPSPIIRISKYSSSINIFLLASVLLTIFSLFYFEIIYSYEFTDNESSFIYMLTIPMSYVIGYSIDYSRLPYWPFNLVIITLFIIGGGVTFVYLSVGQVNHGSLSEFLITNRRVTSFWGANSEPINGPSLDLYNILGTSLLPVILYGKDNKNKGIYAIVALLASVTFFLALYSSVALQGRTPIIALITALFITTIFVIAKYKNKNKFIWSLFLTLIGLFLLANLENILSQGFNYFLNKNLLTRFKTMGFETARYNLWETVLKGVFDYPFGGRKIVITGNSYAHNLWLDVAYDAGLLPMFLLVLFHALHVKLFFKIFRSELPRILIILFMSLGVAFLIGFMGTPVIQASRYYFSTSCFFLGLITRLSGELLSNHAK